MITLTFTTLAQLETFVNNFYSLLHQQDAATLEGILEQTQQLEKQASSISTTPPTKGG